MCPGLIGGVESQERREFAQQLPGPCHNEFVIHHRNSDRPAGGADPQMNQATVVRERVSISFRGLGHLSIGDNTLDPIRQPSKFALRALNIEFRFSRSDHHGRTARVGKGKNKGSGMPGAAAGARGGNFMANFKRSRGVGKCSRRLAMRIEGKVKKF